MYLLSYLHRFKYALRVQIYVTFSEYKPEAIDADLNRLVANKELKEIILYDELGTVYTKIYVVPEFTVTHV